MKIIILKYYLKILVNFSDNEVFVKTGRSLVPKIVTKLKSSVEILAEKISGNSIPSGYSMIEKVMAFII